MDGVDLKALGRMLQVASGVEVSAVAEPNFFSIGGSGYLENPTSDLMAMFMGGMPQHVPPWLAMALVDCLVEQGQAEKEFVLAWDNIRVEREAPIDGHLGGTKFLDILLSDGANVVGIENKVFAPSNYNPFADYTRLLERRAVGGKVLSCILQSYPRQASDTPKWPVVTYAELVDKALRRFGQDVVDSSQWKWQFFYQEFLGHLKHLAEQHMTQEMSPEGTRFILDNFDMLQKALALIDRFDADLTAELSRTITGALSQQDKQDVAVKTGYGNWGSGRKALRFFPDIWGGKSQIVVYYFAEKGTAGDGTMGFGVRAYISAKNTRPLKDIEAAFMHAIEAGTLPATLMPKPRPVFYEESGNLLCLNTYPKPRTRATAVEAAKDLALWVQQYAFRQAY